MINTVYRQRHNSSRNSHYALSRWGGMKKNTNPKMIRDISIFLDLWSAYFSTLDDGSWWVDDFITRCLIALVGVMQMPFWLCVGQTRTNQYGTPLVTPYRPHYLFPTQDCVWEGSRGRDAWDGRQRGLWDPRRGFLWVDPCARASGEI